MDQQSGTSSHDGNAAEAAASVALFALWRGCAPRAPAGLHPRFVLSGMVTSEGDLSLRQVAPLIANVSTPCWLVAASEDLSAPDAVLGVTVAHEETAEASASLMAKARPFPIGEHLMPGDMHPEAPVLVFGGYQRLAVTPTILRAARARFRLIGPMPRVSADTADSPWAESLLPASDRAGFEWTILLGGSVAYDPPWHRDAV